MADSVQMPALGESVTEGTVTRWLKQVGDRVEVDEPLLEVSTDKVDTEIPSPVAGVLQKIVVAEDETVEVGADLAVIGEEADAEGGGGGSADGGNGADDASAAASAPPSEPATEEPAKEEPAKEEQPAPSAPSAGSGSGGSSGGGTPVAMPALGESVTEGTVTRWLKQVGDQVEVDEPLLEVSTDKVDTEIPSPVAGTLQEILVQEDETVEVGARLALVGDGAAAPSKAAAAPEETAKAPSEPAQPSPAEGAAAPQVADTSSGDAERQEAPEAPAAAPEPEQAAEDYNSAAPQTGGGVAPPTGGGTAPAGQGAPAGGSTSTPDTVSSYVTPLVRKLAAQHDVDLASLTGTGVGGRIRKQDVLDAAESKRSQQAEAQKAESHEAESQKSGSQKSGSQKSGSQRSDAASAPSQPQPAAAASPARQGAPAGGAGSAVGAKRGTTEKMTRLRKVIAQRMVESLQVSAQLTSVVEVDVTRVARLRARAKDDFKAREGAGLSFLPFFALASVEALKAFPQVNASLEGETIVYHPQENLGVAVDTERGLLVPVIKDAGDLNIAGLARKIADLAARTRANKVTPDELGGGTFTLTNTGSRGALFDTPIINQPQVAILGTGAVVKRPVVVADADGAETIGIRSMVYLALSYDHRIVDGADAARFLTAMKLRLEEGAFEDQLGLTS